MKLLIPHCFLMIPALATLPIANGLPTPVVAMPEAMPGPKEMIMPPSTGPATMKGLGAGETMGGNTEMMGGGEEMMGGDHKTSHHHKKKPHHTKKHHEHHGGGGGQHHSSHAKHHGHQGHATKHHGHQGHGGGKKAGRAMTEVPPGGLEGGPPESIANPMSMSGMGAVDASGGLSPSKLKKLSKNKKGMQAAGTETEAGPAPSGGSELEAGGGAETMDTGMEGGGAAP